MPRKKKEVLPAEKAKNNIRDFFKSGEWKELKNKLNKVELEPIKNPFETLSAKNDWKICTNTVLDTVLGRGGLCAKKLAILYGGYGSGKTQIAFTLLVEVGEEGTVFYDDSEFTFSPERIEQIAKERGKDFEKIKKNIILVQPEDWIEHLAAPSKVPSPIDLDQQGRPPLKLIIIDSLIAPFDKTKDFMGLENLRIRSQMFRLFFADLRKLARMHNCPVLVANQIVSNINVNVPNPKYAPMCMKQLGKGGPTVEHVPDIVIYLRRVGASIKRVAKLMDSSELEPSEVLYIINEKGIDDIPDESKKSSEEDEEEESEENQAEEESEE